MKICSLRNENQLCEMKICSLRNENLQFAKFGFLEQLLEENYPLGRHSETHAKVVMKLFEAASCFC